MSIAKHKKQNIKISRRDHGTPKPNPCPCCGNKKLYVGHLLATVVGVECTQCGLKIGRDLIFDKIPFKIRKDSSFSHLLRDEFKHLTNLAIAAWNKRHE